jgi:predicted  nucleic acid-binding Zn-ribbon protein
MADDQGDALPEPLDSWLRERAAETDEDTGEVLSRAVALYRLVEERARDTDGEMPPMAELDDVLGELENHVTALDDRVESIEDDLDGRGVDAEDRIAGIEDEFDEKITDVRERIIQVKRETDGKAPADHEHPELRDRVEGAATAATRASDRLDELEADVDRGFENYEEVLEHLVDETEDVGTKLTRLASVVADLRRRTGTVEERVGRVESAAQLKTVANRQGETRADCGECSNRVQIGLLTEPGCPHCGANFYGVEPSTRFFGSATLVTERRPALTAGEATTEGADGDGDGADGAAADGSADESPSTVTELFGGSR